MENDEFRKRLTELRIAKGVSARDMSLSIGQSAGYINNIENGVNLPSMTVFFYICEYLGVSPADFFSFESKHPVKINELINVSEKLSAEQIDHLVSIAKWLK